MKATYYERILEENKNNIRKTLKNLIGRTNDKSGFPNGFEINNSLVTDRQVAAKAFNNFSLK